MGDFECFHGPRTRNGDQSFVLSDQDGVLVGDLSLQEKKNIFAALY